MSYKEAVQRAGDNDEIQLLQNAGGGYVTWTEADQRRFEKTALITTGIFFVTNEIPLMLSPYSMRASQPTLETPKLYNRGGYRQSTLLKAEAGAPKNRIGRDMCPTCGVEIPDVITMQTKKGPLFRRGYDLDHYPIPWSDRVNIMRQMQEPPTRKQVLDVYNEAVRLQCPTCNQSRFYEGIPGDYE
jgi:hypothetical protein